MADEKDEITEEKPPRKDDTIRRTMVDAMHSATTEVPDSVRRITDAAESVRKEGRLLRMETRRARASKPSFPRPEIKAGGHSK